MQKEKYFNNRRTTLWQRNDFRTGNNSNQKTQQHRNIEYEATKRPVPLTGHRG